MLDVALQRDVEGDLLLADMGQGVPFRAGTFDAAISISAVQWLCNVESSGTSARGRLGRFFGGLYAGLRRGGRAVCQFYPRDEAQRAMICGAAVKAGFGAGVLEDGAGTKGVKVYLVLTVGGGAVEGVVEGMEGVEVEGRGGGRGKGERRVREREREEKERMERRGKVVKKDSKYTGRRRRVQF
jgi:18S rRNA (guanine1575-N7)-methyltransferase